MRLVGLIAGLSPVVPETEKDTVPEKWFKGVIVMMDDPLLLALIFTLVRSAVIA